MSILTASVRVLHILDEPSLLQPRAAWLKLAINRLGQGPKLTECWPHLQMQLLQAAQLDFIVSMQQLYPQAHDEVCYG